MVKDWYPAREADRRLFLQNFVEHLADATTLMKLPAGTFQAAADAAQAELDLFVVRDAAQKALDTAQSKLSAQEQLTSTAVRAGVKQIKNTLNVPQDVLDLLELTSATSDTAATVAAQAPVLKVKMDGIHPSIGCVKSGFDAVEIWSQRDGEKDATRLATVTHLPYFDNRPNAVPAQAEQRSYYAYFLKKNEVASGQSATAALLVPGGAHA